MKTSDFVDYVAGVRKTMTGKHCSKKDARFAIDSVIRAIEELTVAGEPVYIHGFGKFEQRERAARVSKFSEEESYEVPARYTVKFTPGKRFVREMLEGYVPPIEDGDY